MENVNHLKTGGRFFFRKILKYYLSENSVLVRACPRFKFFRSDPSAWRFSTGEFNKLVYLLVYLLSNFLPILRYQKFEIQKLRFRTKNFSSQRLTYFRIFGGIKATVFSGLLQISMLKFDLQGQCKTVF